MATLVIGTGICFCCVAQIPLIYKLAISHFLTVQYMALSPIHQFIYHTDLIVLDWTITTGANTLSL